MSKLIIASGAAALVVAFWMAKRRTVEQRAPEESGRKKNPDAEHVSVGGDGAHQRAASKFRAAALKRKPSPFTVAGASAVKSAAGESKPTPGSLQKAMGAVRGVNGQNAALWALGMFKHEPPKFEYPKPSIDRKGLRTYAYTQVLRPRAV